MIRKLKRAFLLLAALFAVGSVTAYTPVVNEVTVDSSGSLSQNPVLLHQTTFARWLADPDYTNWREYYDYPGGGGTPCDYPMITKITYDGQSQFFTNLYPGVQHEYNVGGKSGTFTPASEPPRTLLAPVYGRSGYFVNNFRDLGGWRLEGSSSRTKYDVLFRSANWDDYWRNGDYRARNPMNSQFGIKAEIDLREFDSETKHPDDVALITYTSGTSHDPDIFNEVYKFTVQSGPYAANTTFTHSPSLPEGDESVRYFQCPWVSNFITDSSWGGAKELVRTFKVLGQHSYYPVVFHCAGGRDRTGYLAFLIEALCGVHLDDIYRDHLAIILANKGEIQRVDGYIQGIYSSNNYYDANYGDSLAGRTRKYLQFLGASDSDLQQVIYELTGETADDVLSRVNAHEAANHYRTITYKKGSETVAVYRVGDDTLYREPEVPSGYTAWSAEDANGVRTAVNSATYTATFTSEGATFATQSSTTQATKPSPDPTKSGYTFRGWKVNGSGDVVSFPYALSANTTFVAYFEESTPGPTPSGGGKLAEGGDYVHKENIGGTDYWIHEFSNGTANVTFQNTSGESLEVEYLVVGGGGAGGDGHSGYGGGGGGGAGGVLGSTAIIDPDTVWNIYVGVGGSVTSANGTHIKVSENRGVAGGSAISNANDTVAIAVVPGGGAGASTSTARAKSGAAGGGGSGRNDGGQSLGLEGTYASSVNDETEVVHKGANGSKNNSGAGGGGGAAGDGVAGTDSSSGAGGKGLKSAITGTLKYYGCGGGGGGARSGATAGTGGLDGASGGNGGQSGSPAQSGLNGTGSGGGGGYPDQDSSSGIGSGAAGGDGIVIIRYVAGASTYTATFMSEGDTFATQSDVTQATAPSPAPTKSGYSFVGWKVNGEGNVVSFPYALSANTIFVAYFEQQVTPGPTPSGDALAEGGDYVHKENIDGVNYWIHEFSNGTVNVTFENTSGESLEVEYLVVGGGGAGGDGWSDLGGGGGVLGATGTISAGTIWTISVGKGGYAEHQQTARIAAEGSEIADGSTQIAYAPGGGAGSGIKLYNATSGAAGGGGSGYNSTDTATPWPGTFASQVGGIASEAHRGGNGYSIETARGCGGAGGGGGAGSDGGDGSESASGAGGAGMPSSITGTEVYYGGGGGGGGWKTVTAGVGNAGGGNGGSSSVPAANGLAGTGGGGGGGFGYEAGWVAANPSSAGVGGDGIVIIRYVAGETPATQKYTATFMNGEAVYETQPDVSQATRPSPNPTKSGYSFVGWKVNGTGDVVTFPYALSADTTFHAYFVKAASGERRATGGTVTSYTSGGTLYYVHTFDSPAAAIFENTCGEPFYADYLIVGGGGAGGGSSLGYFGGGGGAGGGVVTGNALMGADGSWTITIGAGGTAPSDLKERGVAGSSSIDFGTETRTAMGGGAGACAGNDGRYATFVANGGGGAATDHDNGYIQYTSGARGDGGYAGGDGKIGTYKYENNTVLKNTYTMAGGGAGAGGKGGNGDASSIYKSGDGGQGFVSSITGEPVGYAGGGGGGGGSRAHTDMVTGGETYGIGIGLGTAGGGDGGWGNKGSTGSGDLVSQAAGNGVRGGGGGGAGAGVAQAGNGGNGIVIIRYAASTGAVIEKWTVTFTTNGVNDTHITVDNGHVLRSGDIPSGYPAGEWDNGSPVGKTILEDTTFNYTCGTFWNVTFSSNSVQDVEFSTKVLDGEMLPDDSIPDWIGTWDADPVGAVITCTTNFNCQITRVWTVKFNKVGNDGPVEMANYTTTVVDGYTLTSEQIPEFGSIVGGVYKGGTWDRDPHTTIITKNETFTWTPSSDPGEDVHTMPFRVVGGAEGSVISFTGSATDTYTEGGKTWVRAGTTVTLSAVDVTGATVLGCWRDDTTGEFLYPTDGTLTVTPDHNATYTACFGTKWVYNSTKGTLSNGDWSFTVDVNGNDLSVRLVFDMAQYRDDGYINFATPIVDTAGKATSLRITTFGKKREGEEAGKWSMFGKNSAAVKTVVPPADLTTVGYQAFHKCGNLSGFDGILYLKDGLYLGGNCFEYCGYITNIVFAGSVVNDDHGFQFSNVTNLTGFVNLPTDITEIPASYFRECRYITGVDLTGVHTVCRDAFEECKSLKTVIGLADIREVGYRSFNYCCITGEYSFTYLENIPYRAFGGGVGAYEEVPGEDGKIVKKGEGHNEFTQIWLPAATNVGYCAFGFCPLTNVVFGTEQVTFYDIGGLDGDKGKYQYGQQTFTGACSTNNGCWFRFPGKAPLMVVHEHGYKDGSPDVGYANHAVGRGMFGSTGSSSKDGISATNNKIFIQGVWENDPTGWQKMFDDQVAEPCGYNTERPDPELPADYDLRGTMKWAHYTKGQPANRAWLVFKPMGLYFFVK